MREIIFRGKSVFTNDWEHGGLIDHLGQPYILGYGGIDKVNADTVGQFTGMTDKKGRHIYEGDIIKSDAGDVGSVEYSEDNAKFLCVYNQISGNWFDFEFGDGVPTGAYLEVIGNIYDNPELLK